ncbi:hypothetical protein PPACK8108_LOCUS11441 [Phakopsora pachyrhizi]|uniref:Uncharacterized protein n=1 Tax=Phakopsora pachyrhizi TaxID=170000 RepID=A0AAV0B3E3_PHAPC|nr:hypothetical protein PPACK8108_LOCUS11441 [Phakopsora pachyrhizi]
MLIVFKTFFIPPHLKSDFVKLEYAKRHCRSKHLNIRPWSFKCGVSYTRKSVLSHQYPSYQNPLIPSLTIQPLSQSYNPLNTNSINNHSSINRQPIYYSITLSSTSRPPPLQLRFITPPKTILTIELKPLRLNSLSISELVFLPVIIYNQLVRPTDRSSTRMFLSNLTSLTLTLNSTSNFHHQQLYLRQPEDGTDDDFINDEELNPDPIDSEYILCSPTSEMVRYSHPQFFITNEPESSPFYQNPTIWILAFLCQRAQGFTIPRICDLSKFFRKAISIMVF